MSNPTPAIAFKWLGCKDVWGCLCMVDDQSVSFELLIIDHFYEGDQKCKLYSEDLNFTVDVMLPDTVGCYYNISIPRLRNEIQHFSQTTTDRS